MEDEKLEKDHWWEEVPQGRGESRTQVIESREEKYWGWKASNRDRWDGEVGKEGTSSEGCVESTYGNILLFTLVESYMATKLS